MPTSPEGVSEILRQLSHVSAQMGQYQISLDAQTRAVEGLHQEVSELRQDVESIKGTMAEKAIKEAEERGRKEERDRLRKYAHQSNDQESGELMPTLMRAGRAPWWRELLNNRFLVAMMTLIIIVGMLILGGGGIVQVVEKWTK